MLVTAIPKSASTALMETLARAHRLPCDMHFRWDGPRSTEFPRFHVQHSFGWELALADVAELTRPDLLYKTHVLPSRNNLVLLHDRPKVVLLRQPEGIIGAYKRGEETGVYRQKTRLFAGCRQLKDWIAAARADGLYEDLAAFRSRWLGSSGDQLVVHYEDLVADPAAWIARIEAYFGLPTSGTSRLLERKYTRRGAYSLRRHRASQDSWKTAGRD